MPKAKAKSNHPSTGKGKGKAGPTEEGKDSGAGHAAPTKMPAESEPKNEGEMETQPGKKCDQQSVPVAKEGNEMQGKDAHPEQSTSAGPERAGTPGNKSPTQVAKKMKLDFAPYSGPRIDPVTFFTQIHSVPHVIDQIMDYRRDAWLYRERDWADEKRMDIKVARQMGFICEKKPWIKEHAKRLKNLGQDNLKRCLRTMLMLHKATQWYKPSAPFSVSRAWRNLMLDRAARGKEPNYAYRIKLESHRECILALSSNDVPSIAYSEDCPECSAIFLLMTETDITDDGLYEWLCRTSEFSAGLDICGRHDDLWHSVEDVHEYGYVSPPDSDDSDIEDSYYRGRSDSSDDYDEDEEDFNDCICQ